MASPRRAHVDAADSRSSPQSDPSGPRLLSCRSCRSRKVKCNKTKPCGPCQRSGLDCVYPPRQRKPKSKQDVSGRSGELLDRISRLENLVEKFGGEDALLEGRSRRTEPTSSSHNASPSRNEDVFIDATESATSAASNRYAGGYFWSCLVEEVDGLKLLLEQEDEDEDGQLDVSASAAGSSEPNHLQTSTFIFEGSHNPLAHPPLGQASIFFNIYFYNVDPIFKLLHKPTLMSLLPKAAEFAASPPTTGALPALFSSMYFAAVTSLSSVDCIKLFHQPRVELLAYYKECTERNLANANFLSGIEIITLQAFVIYLLCLRCHSKDRAGWALVGLAIRLAHSLNIHRDDQGLSFSIYDAEMRRRLWWQIVVLDDRGAQDRATDPMIMQDSFNTKMPSNINDRDFNNLSERPLIERVGPSDMIFGRLIFDISSIIRRLRYVPPTGPNESSSKTLEDMENEIKAETRHIESQYTAKGDNPNPTLSLTSMIGRIVVSKLWLYFWYPQRQQLTRTRNIPRDQALEHAVIVLELTESVESEPTLQHFGWFTNTFVQWHPLAVALAELCSQPLGALANRAWAIIDKIYVPWSDRNADTIDGNLWRPIRILYKKARIVRENHSRDPHGARLLPEASVHPAMQNANNFGMATSHALPQTGFSPQQSNIQQGSITYDPTLEWGNSLIPDTSPRTDMFMYPMDWEVWNEFVSNAELDGAPTHSDMLTGWPMPR